MNTIPISCDLLDAIENRIAYWDALAEGDHALRAYCNDLASELRAVVSAIKTDAGYLMTPTAALGDEE